MVKYSIVSVVNEQYKKFAYVFVKSALDNLNLDHIHEICLLNTGINDNDVSKLESLHEKIRIVKAEQIVSSGKGWDSGWKENVDLKTKFVKEYIDSNAIRTCMVDIDCMFTNDILDVMSVDKEIVLCDRSEHLSNSPYIASFVGFLDIEKSKKFLSEWRNCMKTISGFQTKETPALCKISSNPEYNIGTCSYKIIGLYYDNLYTDDTRIIHFKSDGSSLNLPMDKGVQVRLEKFKQFSDVIQKYLQDV